MAAPKKYTNPSLFSFRAEENEWEDFTLALKMEKDTPTAFFARAMKKYLDDKKPLLSLVRQMQKEQELKRAAEQVVEDNTVDVKPSPMEGDAAALSSSGRATTEVPPTPVTDDYGQKEQPVDKTLEELKKRFGERFTDDELEKYTLKDLEIVAQFSRKALEDLVNKRKPGKPLPSALEEEAVLTVLQYSKGSLLSLK